MEGVATPVTARAEGQRLISLAADWAVFTAKARPGSGVGGLKASHLAERAHEGVSSSVVRDRLSADDDKSELSRGSGIARVVKSTECS